MDNLSSHDYWKEVSEVAQSILDELEIQSSDDYEDKRDEISDYLFETVDGHQWIIYTFYNKEILRHTNNESYSEDNFGTEGYADKSYDEIGLQIAFWAFYADIQDNLYELEQALEAA